MAGMIGVPCSDTARYTAFADSLSNLSKPPDTEIKFAVSTWRQRGRNQLVRWMMEADAEWLLMIDDDHVFAPDLLDRLLSHEKDIVAALCLRRDEPYDPFCFSEKLRETVYKTINLHAHPADALLRVRAVGTGAMLVRRNVFEVLGDPYFTIAEESGEDMRFCDAATEAGFEIYCDLGARIGHMTTAVVWPVSTPDWKVGFVISDETRITRELPPVQGLEA